MKADERDQLLIRIDERTNNIWTLTERQEKHLAELNSSVARNVNRISVLETKVDERSVSPVAYKMSKKAMGGYGSGVVGVLTIIYYIGQARGWW